MIRTDPDQENLIDGTILAFDPRADGAYVTFLGGAGNPVIASIDSDDLDRLGGSILRSVTNFDAEVPSEDQARITPRGIEILKTQLTVNADADAVQSGDLFSFYVEPDVIDCQSGDVIVGLGSIGRGLETACIATSRGGQFEDAFLTREQLGKLIETLGNIHEAMGFDS